MAQEKKHTQGEWTISHGANILPSIGSLLEHTAVCHVAQIGEKVGHFYPESEANAKLIAAAPKMLVSIERFASLNEDEYPEMKGWILEAREIYKKTIEH